MYSNIVYTIFHLLHNYLVYIIYYTGIFNIVLMGVLTQ